MHTLAALYLDWRPAEQPGEALHSALDVNDCLSLPRLVMAKWPAPVMWNHYGYWPSSCTSEASSWSCSTTSSEHLQCSKQPNFQEGSLFDFSAHLLLHVLAKTPGRVYQLSTRKLNCLSSLTHILFKLKKNIKRDVYNRGLPLILALLFLVKYLWERVG